MATSKHASTRTRPSFQKSARSWRREKEEEERKKERERERGRKEGGQLASEESEETNTIGLNVWEVCFQRRQDAAGVNNANNAPR